MEARNRNLTVWYGKVQRGEIKLPRFQRYEVWDRRRICGLIDSVINNLPLGITLVLEVDVNHEKFISRFLHTAPQAGDRVLEHLLDGQQRLTALWRAFHNNYDYETYYVYLKQFDDYHDDEDREDMSVFVRGRYVKHNGERYPLWCDDPAECLRRGFFPTHLFKPEDIQSEIDRWIDVATVGRRPTDDIGALERFMEFKKSVSDRIKDLRAVVANYNLPYLSLPAETDKSVALDVFIKMNTNSKPLSQYEIIVAEIESAMGRSLHDLQDALGQAHPAVGRYSELSDLILTTSALLQGTLPNQRGAWDMDKVAMMANWPTMERGLCRMAAFLRGEGIYDRQRLPTNAVLAVIAALYSDIPESGDKMGRDELLLKRYVWYAFFTNRYENAAATHAYSDFVGLRNIIRGETKRDGAPYGIADVPVFGESRLVEEDELMFAEWPRRATIRGRAILAVACRLGAHDFSTGERLDENNVDNRQYHHIFPASLLAEAGLGGFVALNCALITDTTNLEIGRKDPLQYLRDRYRWTTEDVVNDRLQSHAIPIPELANGGYAGLSEQAKQRKLTADFDRFLARRAALVMRAVRLLVEGRQVSPAVLFNDRIAGSIK